MDRYYDRCNDCYYEKLDVSNWWKECQNKGEEDGSPSIIASARFPDELLQLLFGRLTAGEALPLGLTCRRLYHYLKEAQKRTRELILHISPYNTSLRKEEDFQIANFRSVASKLLTTYSGLRSLSLTSSCSTPDNFSTLFTALATELPLLTTLSLAVYEYNSASNTNPFPLLDHFWRPLAALQPAQQSSSSPSLRQLNITLLYRGYSPRYQLPPLPILRQLSSFTFGNDAPYHTEHTEVVRALGWKEAGGHGVHLTPGVGACLEVTLFKRRVSLDYSYPDYRHVSIEPLLLPYITLLDVAIGWESKEEDKPPNYQTAMATLFRSLPEMRQLRQLKLTIFAWTHPTDYPALLAALSTLTALRTLSIKMDWTSFQLDWSGLAAGVPVLPSVHHLSLNLWRTADHRWDVVERLRLVHAFPELRTLQCTFYHSLTECKQRLGGKSSQYRRCGLELARGVVELLPERIVKTVAFLFDGPFYFSSLEELMPENKVKEQLNACEGKCAQLQEENERLKRQLQELKAELAKSTENAIEER